MKTFVVRYSELVIYEVNVIAETEEQARQKLDFWNETKQEIFKEAGDILSVIEIKDSWD